MSKRLLTNTEEHESIQDETESWPIPVLQENIHYYMENGFMVFTEAYHRSRGICCGNKCRHCPYDSTNVV